MDVQKKASDPPPEWTIGEAEALLRSLKGVLSSRVVARPGGEVEEIHLLTTYEVTPKQTVRNVESALRAHFDLRIDHRTISVAQTTQPGKYRSTEDPEEEAEGEAEGEAESEAAPEPTAAPEPRAAPEPKAPKPGPSPVRASAPPDPPVAPAGPTGRAAPTGPASPFDPPPSLRPLSRPALRLGGPRYEGPAAPAAAPAPGPASIPVSELQAAAQRKPMPMPSASQHPPSEPSPDDGEDSAIRSIAFLGHNIEAERAQRVKITVAVGWNGQRYEGTFVTADVSRSRLNAFASATLDAVQAVVRAAREAGLRVGGDLSLDGIREVEALGRKFVLVSVHAVEGPGVQTLAGTAVVEESPERAVVMATLQATDRWVRGPS